MATATVPVLSSDSIRSTIASAFPFEVGKLPLFGPENLRTPHYGLFRDDSGECVGSAVSSRYTPHTTADVQTLAEAGAGGFGGAANVATYWRSGHHVIIAPTDDWRRGAVDTVWPRLIISAGYDGRPFSASLGLYRDACRNLSWVRSEGERVGAKIRHTAQLRDRLPELIERFRGVAARWSGVVETVERMQARTVSLDDFIASVYPLPDEPTERTVSSYRRRAVSIWQRIARERRALGGESLTPGNPTVSAWEAFNGVQGHAQHDTRRRVDRNPIGRALAAFDDPAVERAEALALAV